MHMTEQWQARSNSPNRGSTSELENSCKPFLNPPLKLVQGQIKSSYGVLCEGFWCNWSSLSKQIKQKPKLTHSNLTTNSS